MSALLLPLTVDEPPGERRADVPVRRRIPRSASTEYPSAYLARLSFSGRGRPRAVTIALAWFLTLLPGLAADPFAEMVRTTEALSPAAQQTKFHLPPGFEIRLVASEPDIAKPMNLTFDGAGRLWVTDSREYPFPAPAGKKGRDAIKILEDQDGDGRAEKITTFAEGLNIPIGLYPYSNGVIALSIPHIYRFADTNGDDHADSQTVLYGPIGFEKDTHGMTSAFRRGFDGWLYACHGFNNTTTLRGADGSSITMNSGNTYRMRVDGTRVEQFTWGQVNPFGLAFDPLGNLYSADCHSSPVYQLLRGGFYPSFGKPHDGLGFGPVMMLHSHGSTAIGGIVYYAARKFPPEFHDNFFVGNVMTSRINRDRLRLHGSSPEAEEAPDFLSCDDPWFRPVDLQLGPDGALYVADFYNRIIGHYEVPLDHPGRDRERGRIWRIAYVGAGFGEDKEKETRPPNLRQADAAGLLKALDDVNLTVRMLAMNELTDRLANAAVTPLVGLLEGSASARQKIHGLWVLHRLGALETNGLIDRAVKDNDPGVRAHAMKILAEMAEPGAARLTFLRRGLNDQHPAVQRAAADALGQHPGLENVEPLLRLIRTTSPEDTHLRYVSRMALRNQLKDPQQFSGLRQLSLDAEEQQILAAVVLGVASSDAASFILGYLQQSSPGADKLPDYLRHVARYGSSSAVEVLPGIAARQMGTDLELQLALLKAVEEGAAQRGAAPGPAIQGWGQDLAEKLLASAKPEDGWMNVPVPDGLQADNPWIRQRRASADGEKGAIFLSSLKPGGEALTGILRSPAFSVPARLSFYLAGHDGFPGKPAQHRNGIRLRNEATGEVLAETFAPRNDLAQRVVWDLAAHRGTRAVIELVDQNHEDAYAWIAAGRFEPAALKLPAASPSARAERVQAAADLAAKLKIAPVEPKLAAIFSGPEADLATRINLGRALLVFHPDEPRYALAPLLGETVISLPVRQELGEVLRTNAAPGLLEELRRAFQGLPARGQIRVVRTLAATAPARAVLWQLIESGAISPRLLLDTRVKNQLVAGQPADTQDRINRLTRDLQPIRQETEKLIAERRASYDPAEASALDGAAIFEKNCGVCHQIDGRGGVVGPQLDGVGNRGVDRLCEDILDPNQNVDRAFRTQVVVLHNGDVVTGLLRRTEGKVMVLADSTGKEISIPEQEIKERRESETSLMPDNFGDLLPPAEMNHLLAFLLSKRK